MYGTALATATPLSDSMADTDLAARAASGDDGAFAWGIEADGEDFARLGCARDRHHGWAGALAGMGWQLAQTWSADWLERPREAEARLRVGFVAPDGRPRRMPAPWRAAFATILTKGPQ